MAEQISDLSGVGPKTVDKIEAAGANSLADLAQTDIDELVANGLTEAKAEELVGKAEQEAVMFQTGADVIEENEHRNTIPSGMGNFDETVDGGWQEGDIVAVYGSSGAGKTQVSFNSLVAAVEATGRPAIYIETERNRFNVSRLKDLADDPEVVEDLIIRVKAYDLDSQLRAYQAAQQQFDEPSIVVIDSFTARFRLSDKFEGRGSLSDRSATMGKHLSTIEQMADSLEVPVILTAQVYQSPSQYDSGDIPYGGSLFAHTVSYMLHLSDGQGDLKTAQILNHPGLSEEELEIKISDTDLQAFAED